MNYNYEIFYNLIHLMYNLIFNIFGYYDDD